MRASIMIVLIAQLTGISDVAALPRWPEPLFRPGP